jgi:hypothetical protein
MKDKLPKEFVAGDLVMFHDHNAHINLGGLSHGAMKSTAGGKSGQWGLPNDSIGAITHINLNAYACIALFGEVEWICAVEHLEKL